MTEHFVGLMSGTSMDGIDAVVVSFGNASVELHAAERFDYRADLRARLLHASRKPLTEPVDPNGDLHRAVGSAFRDAANAIVAASGVARADIAAIGSHGQTLRHCPDADPPYTVQVGDGDLIAEGTKLTTVTDFRSADLAVGGQGAPLVPPFHRWLFHSTDETRVVVNVGGIANITVLPASGPVTGFDTGPGNGLMDAWIRHHRDLPFDTDGEWAAGGICDSALLADMLNDPYFDAAPPKSTGFEYFNRDWINSFDVGSLAAANVQATLCELTAITIARAIGDTATAVFVCGGGVHNRCLMQRLAVQLPDKTASSTQSAGLNPDWVEAVAFAWLARERLAERPGNLPSVTGANKSVLLGELHLPG